MYCPKCGAQIPDGSKFCNNCGYQIPVSGENVTTEERKEAEPQKGRRRWGVFFIAIFLLVVYIVGMYFSNTPELRDVYYFSKITYSGNSVSHVQLKSQFEENFIDTYLVRQSDGYYILDLDRGMGVSESDLLAWLTQYGISPEIVMNKGNSNYAYIEMTQDNTYYKVTITYTKATLTQRLAYLTKYYF